MSRGMPSMTALLGLLAIAGYQNRDKLAGMFRNATSEQQGARSADPLSGMIGNIGGLLGGGGVVSLLNGGLGELLEHFKQNGQGDVLQKLEQQTGLSQQEILERLSRELPNAVDKYTPEGRIPAAA
ncbi:YidB family protein [Bradyrhizobium diazoefficiens]